MIQIWIIAGNRGVGKSSTIRCITGIRKKSIIRIKKNDGHYFHIYSFLRSIQEAQLGSPENFQRPSDFCDLLENDFFLGEAPTPPSIRMSNQLSVANYLVPLRIDPANNLPGYIEYIGEMLRRGFVIKSLISLNNVWDNALNRSGIDVGMISNSADISANERAAVVRKYWGWV